MTATDQFRGELDFCSNFFVHNFYLPELNAWAPTAEHAFNALKTTDRAQQQHVLTAGAAREAKARGRKVTLRPDWDSGRRVWAMQRILVAKFSDHTLSQRLVATGDRLLVENNTWHDQFWGNCTCPKHAATPGTNMLGESLMALRAHFTA